MTLNHDALITRLTEDISRNAYQARIRVALQKLDIDRDMMLYHELTARGKAFEAIEVLSLITDEPMRGHNIYQAADLDATGDCKRIEAELGTHTKEGIVALLDKAGFLGEDYYRVLVQQGRFPA